MLLLIQVRRGGRRGWGEGVSMCRSLEESSFVVWVLQPEGNIIACFSPYQHAVVIMITTLKATTTMMNLIMIMMSQVLKIVLVIFITVMMPFHRERK